MVYNFYPNFVFVGGSDNTANAIILEQFTLLSKSVGMNIAEYTITDVNETEVKRVAEVAFGFAKDEGSYIISTIDNEQLLEALCKCVKDKYVANDKISIGFLYLFNDKLLKYMDTKYPDLYSISAYIKVYSSESSEDKSEYTDLIAANTNLATKDPQVMNKMYVFIYYLFY